MSSYYKGKDTARNFLRTRFRATKACRTAKKNRDELEAIVSDLSKKAIGSSYWKGEYDVYKQRLQDVRAYYNFGDCDNYFNRFKVDELGKIVDRESSEYQELVDAQTKKQNKIVLVIGGLVMAVGTIIILKRK